MNISLRLPNHPFFAISAWLQAMIAERAHKTQATCRQKRDELYFSPNQIREVSRPLGVTVECLKGSVWVTIDGDSRDVILGAGQSLRLDRDRRTLIMALGQAHVCCIDTVAV